MTGLPDDSDQQDAWGWIAFGCMSRKGFDLVQTPCPKGSMAMKPLTSTSYEVFAHGPYHLSCRSDRKALSGQRCDHSLQQSHGHCAQHPARLPGSEKPRSLCRRGFLHDPKCASWPTMCCLQQRISKGRGCWTYSGIVGSERALPKAAEGRYDRRDDYDIWRGLGLQLGQAPDWPWDTLEDLYDYRLKPIHLHLQGVHGSRGISDFPKRVSSI